MTSMKAQLLSGWRLRRGGDTTEAAVPEDPPPPYSPAPVQRTTSRPLPTPPGSAHPRSSSRSSSFAADTGGFGGRAGGDAEHLEPVRPPAARSASSSSARARPPSINTAVPSAAYMPSTARKHKDQPSSPAYRPASRARGPASLSTIPVNLLLKILELTLDPLATPEDYLMDIEAESARRVWAMFMGLRGVDRRFFLVCTAILRARLTRTYQSLLPPSTTSHLTPPPGETHDPTREPVFARRTRELAVLDRFVALRVGEDMRRAESALTEDLGEEVPLFTQLQPVARCEDLLLVAPRHLIVPARRGGRAPPLAFPLPHTHLTVALSPLWAQVLLWSAPVVPSGAHRKSGRQLVVEVRRGATPEKTVLAILKGMEEVLRGAREWGLEPSLSV